MLFESLFLVSWMLFNSFYFILCSFTRILIKGMDQSGTFLLVKGLGLYFSLMRPQETSMPPKVWIVKRRHTMYCMHKPLIAGQTSFWNRNQSLLLKCKTSMTMHLNSLMDHSLPLYRKCLTLVRRINFFFHAGVCLRLRGHLFDVLTL